MTHLFGSRPAQYVAWHPRYAEEQPRHSTPGQRVWGSGGNNGSNGNYGNYGNNGNSGRCSHYENHGQNGNDMMGPMMKVPGNYRHSEGGYTHHGSYGNYGNYGNNGNSGNSSRYINSGQNGNRSTVAYLNY